MKEIKLVDKLQKKYGTRQFTCIAFSGDLLSIYKLLFKEDITWASGTQDTSNRYPMLELNEGNLYYESSRYILDRISLAKLRQLAGTYIEITNEIEFKLGDL